MKSIWTGVILLVFVPTIYNTPTESTHSVEKLPAAQNLIIVTTDGFRWQELFNGADSVLINDEHFTGDTSTTKLMFWSGDYLERRKKLMPFFWNVIANKGQVFGNRKYNNKVDVANLYSLSYPGYNEIFTGNTDIMISSNKKINNPNTNVLEYLNSLPSFSGKIAAFTSWDVFPFIFNDKRNHLPINSGYAAIDVIKTSRQTVLNALQNDIVADKKATRYDQLTFLSAMEYLKIEQPRVLYLGLGETDEYAHDGHYDLYLQQAASFDKMLADLWYWIQSTPAYKDKTTVLITTDHGRGSKSNKWTSHGGFVKGSSQTWFAILGPGIKPVGEIKEPQQTFQQQLARTISGLVGVEFESTQAARPVTLFQ